MPLTPEQLKTLAKSLKHCNKRTMDQKVRSSNLFGRAIDCEAFTLISEEVKKEWFTTCLPLLRRNVSEH